LGCFKENGWMFYANYVLIKIDMKRLFLLLSFVMMGVCAAMAQAPEKMTYQAVVRNSGNSLVANQNVSVRLSILQGSTQGAPVYVENHTATTNDNGLMTVEIGGGAPTTGVFANIDWANGPYFLKSEIDPTGGINYSIESVQQLMSVPYALYAKEAGNGFSGDYNDLTNRPQIPQVPTNVSAFTNDAGYITKDSIPTNVSAFTNDAGYVTVANVQQAANIPTNVSAFTNDAGYLTSFTESQILSISNDTIYLTGGSFVKLPAGFDGDYNSLTNKPNLAPVATTGSYNDITGKPNLAPVATSGEYNDLTGKPNLAPVATTGNYNDLTNRPQIPQVPTNVSAFTNDAGYITMDSVPAIPTVPTNVSAFTNDAGYLTSFTESQILSISNDTIYLTGGSFVKLPVGFDGDYNSLTNKPNLAPVATTGSYNDITGKPNLAPVATSGEYNDLTGKPNLAPVATSGNYNDLTNRPQIPQVPTNVSAFTNDAGYITQAAVPTNVSQLQNDAGYITKDSIPAGLAGSQTGDIMYWDAGTNTWIMMPAGTSGQVLTMENGVPRWASLPDYVTMNLPPTVTTTVPSEVTQSSVLCGGVVTSDGSVQLTACGVCWSTHHFPTIADAHTENDLGVSAFTSHVSNLAHHTTYYVRAYATNSVGTSYGAEMTFTTTDIPTDSLMMPNPCSSTDTNAVAQPTLGPNYLICAGTDSVELSLGNYQYGSIQWQYSLDTISWFDIPNAFDEQLVYKPEQTQFVRAEVSYANCPPEHSEVKLLQKTPTANAGISRTANIGDTLHLQANMEENATGSWQILQGANGLLKTPTEAASKFYGTDSLYRLRWTLTNSCGTSSDDINVRYVRPKVSSKVVVVDTTDIIFSDSAQLAHGYYVISFSDSNIVIGDSTILVSLVNGGFLRKVDSWSMANDSTYAMYTTQATLYDIMESGVINFGGISSGDNGGGSIVENAVENTPAQNTPRNAPMQNTSSVQNIEFLDHIPTRKELREHPEMNGKMYVMGMEFVREDGSRVNLTPRGGTQRGTGSNAPITIVDRDHWEYKNPSLLTLNDIAGIRFGETVLKLYFPQLEYCNGLAWNEYRYLKLGFYNAICEWEGKCEITPSANGSIPYAGIRLGYLVVECDQVVEGIPIHCTLNIQLDFNVKGSLNIRTSKTHRFKAATTFTYAIRFDENTRSYIEDPLPSKRYFTGESFTSSLLMNEESIDLELSLKAKHDVMFFSSEHLTSSTVVLKDKIYCVENQQGNFQGWKGMETSDMSVNLSVKSAETINQLPTCSKDWTINSGGRIYPYKVELNEGNYQTISASGSSLSQISVRVIDNYGKPVENVPVYFLPADGGFVSDNDNMVTTDPEGIARIIWTPGPFNGQAHTLTAYVFDDQGHANTIKESPITFTAYEPGTQSQTNNCSTLQLLVNPASNNNKLELKVQNGTAPITYTMDGNVIQVSSGGSTSLGGDIIKYYDMPAVGSHEFKVTDNNGCVATKSYNVEGDFSQGGVASLACIGLWLKTTTTSGRIEAEGQNGKAPYLYYLENHSSSYSQNNVFTSLSPGTYTVHVKDDNGCEASEQVEVVVDNTSSQSALPCAGAATVRDVDGNVYPTLKIGNQCWMAENLRTEHYADGETIGIGAGCFYPNDNSENKSKYGLLYTWRAAVRNGGNDGYHTHEKCQGVCPDGWHVPHDEEWAQLLSSSQLVSYPAKGLATKDNWEQSTTLSSPGYESYRNNGIGFNASPAGYFHNIFYDLGKAAWFWTSCHQYGNGAYSRDLSYNRATVGNESAANNGGNKDRAHSVRCLRD
jgi:uncharacterized protein (TIGR02145 family)